MIRALSSCCREECNRGGGKKPPLIGAMKIGQGTMIQGKEIPCRIDDD